MWAGVSPVSPGADVGRGEPSQSRCRCGQDAGRGEPSQSRRRCGRRRTARRCTDRVGPVPLWAAVAHSAGPTYARALAEELLADEDFFMQARLPVCHACGTTGWRTQFLGHVSVVGAGACVRARADRLALVLPGGVGRAAHGPVEGDQQRARRTSGLSGESSLSSATVSSADCRGCAVLCVCHCVDVRPLAQHCNSSMNRLLRS